MVAFSVAGFVLSSQPHLLLDLRNGIAGQLPAGLSSTIGDVLNAAAQADPVREEQHGREGDAETGEYDMKAERGAHLRPRGNIGCLEQVRAGQRHGRTRRVQSADSALGSAGDRARTVHLSREPHRCCKLWEFSCWGC